MEELNDIKNEAIRLFHQGDYENAYIILRILKE